MTTEKKKKRTVLETLWHYGITTSALTAACIAVIDLIACRALEAYLDDWTLLRYGDDLMMLVHIAALITCAYMVYRTIRQAVYADRTGGRSYGADHGKYKRYYGDLLDYYRDADPHRLDPETLPKENWKDAEGIMFGTVRGRLVHLSSYAEGNVFVAGAPGSAKTRGIAIPSAARYAGSVLAIDIKGDIYAYTHQSRKILRFCPDLKDAYGNSIAAEHSCHFDPLSGIADMDPTDRKLALENMAATLIPHKGGKDGNYFEDGARKILIGVAQYLLYLKPDLSFPQLLHAILHHRTPDVLVLPECPKDIFEWTITIMQSPCDNAIEQVGSFYNANEKNVAGCMDSLCSALVHFSSPVMDELLSPEGECISAASLDAGYDVYLQISQENLSAYAPLFSLIIQTMMMQLSSRPDKATGIKNRPVMILIDELPSTTISYESLSLALATLRSKSVQVVMISQSIAQLAYKFTEDGWRALLGNCTYYALLKSQEPTTCKFFSDLFGTRKVLRISNSADSSRYSQEHRTVQETREPVYQPEDFGDLKKELIVYCDGKRIKAKKILDYD